MVAEEVVAKEVVAVVEADHEGVDEAVAVEEDGEDVDAVVVAVGVEVEEVAAVFKVSEVAEVSVVAVEVISARNEDGVAIDGVVVAEVEVLAADLQVNSRAEANRKARVTKVPSVRFHRTQHRPRWS